MKWDGMKWNKINEWNEIIPLNEMQLNNIEWNKINWHENKIG